MLFKFYYFIFFLASSLSAVESPNLHIPTVGPDGKLVSLIIMQVEKDSNGNVLIQHGVGINSFEQVSFLLNCDKDNAKENNIRIGPQYVCNVMTRVSNIDGIFKSEFLPLSAGSGLVIIGKDKSMKAIGDLPLGLTLDNNFPKLKFVLIARVKSNDCLPLNPELALKWTNLTYVEKLIADGDIVLNN